MKYDVVIIGGGFYGCAIALHLRHRGFKNILIVERESDLLTRASYCNQARVHNGYHYPRSFVTACRSRINLPKFCRDYGFAIETNFLKLYAIAARRSKVTSNQFERFMQDIGASYERTNSNYRNLFNPRLIASVYITEEYAFNAVRLRSHFAQALSRAGINVWINTEARRLSPNGQHIDVLLRTIEGERRVQANMVLNCAYASLNHNVFRPEGLTPLKHEVTEIALVAAPKVLENIGVTIMDGPFFSCMPFPAEDCHSLSHVRYTPHGFFIDTNGQCNPIQKLRTSPPQTRVHYMIADAARFMPCLREAQHRRSLFEIKTVLVRNEADDGRPILFRIENIHPRVFSILGAKIDNIYDILQQLDSVVNDESKKLVSDRISI